MKNHLQRGTFRVKYNFTRLTLTPLWWNNVEMLRFAWWFVILHSIRSKFYHIRCLRVQFFHLSSHGNWSVFLHYGLNTFSWKLKDWIAFPSKVLEILFVFGQVNYCIVFCIAVLYSWYSIMKTLPTSFISKYIEKAAKFWWFNCEENRLSTSFHLLKTHKNVDLKMEKYNENTLFWILKTCQRSWRQS